MTEPGIPSDVPDADRAEQEALLGSAAVGTAADAVAPAADVPEADALEQQLAATPGSSTRLRDADPEADEADVLEQQTDVPDDEDDLRG